MEQLLGHLVSAILDLPTWTPRSIRRAAAAVLITTIVFAPHTFREGFQSWVDIETKAIMARIAPLLHPNQSSANSRKSPAPFSRPRPNQVPGIR